MATTWIDVATARGQPLATAVARTAAEVGTGRLVSLDAFRGAVVAGMELVNNPGPGIAGWHTYAPLTHVRWHGWSFADVIAPAFLWIVGLSLTLSFEKRRQAGATPATLFKHAVRRAAIIFALGLALVNLPSFPNVAWTTFLGTFTVTGILQRIALCYLGAAVLVLWTGVRGQVLWTLGLLAAYWLMLELYPVPGVGPGVLERPYHVTYFVDTVLLGAHAQLGDEGLLSYLSAIATTMFGVLTGHFLRRQLPAAERTAWLFAGGALLLVAGAVMNWWMPINRGLWTPSFAVFMAGISLQAFAVLHWLIDLKGYRVGTRPFVVLGMNAITVFVLSGMLRVLGGGKGFTVDGRWMALNTYLFEKVFAPLGGPEFASLAFSAAWLGMMYAVAALLYRKRWFLRV